RRPCRPRASVGLRVIRQPGRRSGPADAAGQLTSLDIENEMVAHKRSSNAVANQAADALTLSLTAARAFEGALNASSAIRWLVEQFSLAARMSGAHAPLPKTSVVGSSSSPGPEPGL